MADPQPSNPVPPASDFTSIGNELDPRAPLWKTYGDEVRKLDLYFEELHKTVDTLLIFAGLFSAVVTSFVIASFPLLIPGNQTDAVVNAVHALALAINSSMTLATPPEPVTASSIWVNGLWFTSLFITLSVALVAILAKQWFWEYEHDEPEKGGPTPFRPHLAGARRRQVLFIAFPNWHIPVLITLVLPFLLHVALFLFIAGLSVFVWTLNMRIALCMTVLTVLLSGLYVIATVLPIFRADCPTATPLIRGVRGRGREVPTWIAVKAVQLWSLILPIALRAFGPSRVTFRDVPDTLDHLRRRQKRIRASGWLVSAGTTDDNVKLDMLRWLILASASETAITAVFLALGAVPPDSPFIHALRVITVGMGTAVECLARSQIPSTAVEVIRAVRSDLILGRGFWGSPQLGFNLSSSFTGILRESQHPDARLLSAAMHCDGKHYTRQDGAEMRSFESVYAITDALLRGKSSSDSGLSTVRLLLYPPGISVPAFACLSVLLARSLHFRDSDETFIFRIFHRLRNDECYANDRPHKCDGLCVVVFMVCRLDLDDPASIRIVPIILSHLLPRLMGESDVPLSLSRGEDFFRAIARSHWLQSPCPAGNTDVAVLSTLLQRFHWSHEPSMDAYLRIFEWFMSRALYGTLHSLGLIAKLHGHPSMLRVLCRIVDLITPNHDRNPDDYEENCLSEFLASQIQSCGDLSPYSDEHTRDVLFRLGLVPKIGACLERMGARESWLERERGQFFSMVDAALGSLDEHVENKEEYLLHLAQHCVTLAPTWTQRDEVRDHLDAHRMEELLVQKGPCTQCTEGSADKWPDEFLALVQPVSPTVERPQPGPPALPPRDATSTPLAPSAPAVLSTTASPPDVALSSSDAATPNAISVLRVESTPMPILHAATGSGPVSSGAGSNPIIATLSLPPGYSVLVSSLDSTPAANAPSGTTPHAVIVSSSRTPDTPPVATAPTQIRAPEVSPSATSPSELEDIGSRVVSQPGTASPGDGASTANVAHDSPSDSATSSVGQGHDDRVTHTSRAISYLADEAPSAAAVRMATSSAATGSSSTSGFDVTPATASLPAITSSPYAAATTTSSPDLTAAHSQARTATASASSSDSADSDVDDTAGVDVEPGSSSV